MDIQNDDLPRQADVTLKLRRTLIRRLLDISCQAGMTISDGERMLATDLLANLLHQATRDEQILCAQRIAESPLAPPRLVKLLASASFEVAEPLLSRCDKLDPLTLTTLVQISTDHAIAIASNEDLPSIVADLMIDMDDLHIITALLKNKLVSLSEVSLDKCIEKSKSHKELVAYLIARPELHFQQAMALFWWADSADRSQLIDRYAITRDALTSVCEDLFPIAAKNGCRDMTILGTFALVERRQLNRRALETRNAKSISHFIMANLSQINSPNFIEDLARICGIKPSICGNILNDENGEPVAIFAKACSMDRESLGHFWQALKPAYDDAKIEASFANMLHLYDSLSLAKAQTILRYWNWSFVMPALRQVA